MFVLCIFVNNRHRRQNAAGGNDEKILAALTLCGLLLTVPLIKVEQQDFLRIHVRADSNEQTDQQIKFAVKDEVEKLLSDKLQGADTKAEAMRRIEGALEEITQVCNATLDKNGKSYRASVAVKRKPFRCAATGRWLCLRENTTR